jgi:HAD superfamily hydrolase (TIGR01509 family)
VGAVSCGRGSVWARFRVSSAGRARSAGIRHTGGVAVEAVIFDFDGLLMDTESTALASWQYEWRQHGLEFDVTSYFVEHGGDASAERYAKLAAAVGPDYVQADSHARRTTFRERLNLALGLADGVAQWLDEAAALGLRLAIASSSPRSWVRGHLGRVGVLARFDIIACGDEVGGPKPDPAVYELALSRLGVAAPNAVAVEDTPHGVAAAHAAGIRCIAIPNPHADRSRFAAADLLLCSAADVSLAEALALAKPAPCVADEPAAGLAGEPAAGLAGGPGGRPIPYPGSGDAG